MRILITGVCGFVGGQIARTLLEHFENLALCGIDNFLRPGSETNRAPLQALGVQVRHGDVRSAADWEALAPADWVIDAAAEPSVLAGVDRTTSARQLVGINLGGTIETLEYCRRHHAGFILLSTSRVYSIQAMAGLPVSVRDGSYTLDASKPWPAGVSEQGIAAGFSTASPISLYGATKLASEVLAAEYAFAFQLPGYINRCGVLSGAGQFGTAAQGIFAFWINAHLRRHKLTYLGFGGRGHQTRDVLHARDLAALIAQQIRRPQHGRSPLYTVGGGTECTMSLRQLTAWCDERFQSPRAVAPDAASRPYDIPWFVTDARQVQAEFDWTPQHSLTAILEEIAAHAEAHPGWLALSGATAEGPAAG